MKRITLLIALIVALAMSVSVAQAGSSGGSPSIHPCTSNKPRPSNQCPPREPAPMSNCGATCDPGGGQSCTFLGAYAAPGAYITVCGYNNWRGVQASLSYNPSWAYSCSVTVFVVQAQTNRCNSGGLSLSVSGAYSSVVLMNSSAVGVFYSGTAHT